MKTNLPSLFESSGETLAIAGMTVAKENADRVVVGWSDRCWQLFYHWLNRKPRYFEFMIEDFRKYLKDYDLLEDPPSLRAFGFLSKRALKREIIGHAGTGKVKNIKAHSTPVNVWFKK